ncbi:MAG: type II secretion system F family protein [Desulfobacteraceae bacterium]|nr:MAG: type II secretion system F family protein [Desulfobacteraceae bacterium]
MLFQRTLLLKESGLFYRQMAYLLASGATLPEALTILHDESDDLKIRNITDSIQAKLTRGDSISQSLSDYPQVFNPTLAYLLSTDQENKKTSEFLYQYADELERMDSIKLRLLQTLAYPCKVLAFAALVMFFLMIFVVPVFQEFFQDSGLPPPTRFVLTISIMARDYWFVVLPGLIGLFLLITKSKKFLYKIGSRLPGLRALLNDFSVYSFSKNLSILIPLNRPLPETIEQAARMVRDQAYAERIIRASQNIQNMEQFKEQARKNKILPGLFCSVLAIGNRTQSLDKLLAEMARFFENRITKRIEIVTNFLEAFTIIFIGMVVGFMVIALYLPIFKLTSFVG